MPASSFDSAALLERVDNDTDFLAETVEMLAADAPTLLAQLRDAAAANDAPAVTRAAHALKGMISNFCAAETQAAAYEIEKLGKVGDVSGVTERVERLAAQVSALTSDLEAFVRSRSSGGAA